MPHFSTPIDVKVKQCTRTALLGSAAILQQFGEIVVKHVLRRAWSEAWLIVVGTREFLE
jgi:hypothetical protein